MRHLRNRDRAISRDLPPTLPPLLPSPSLFFILFADLLPRFLFPSLSFIFHFAVHAAFPRVSPLSRVTVVRASFSLAAVTAPRSPCPRFPSNEIFVSQIGPPFDVSTCLGLKACDRPCTRRQFGGFMPEPRGWEYKKLLQVKERCWSWRNLLRWTGEGAFKKPNAHCWCRVPKGCI